MNFDYNTYPWLYQGEPLTEAPKGVFGFVYCITNLQSGRRYIGKKNFQSLRKQKTGRRKSQESDWRGYFGSSDVLKADLLSLGLDNFKRDILYLCKSQGELNFLEIECQIKWDVFRDPEKWYNDSLMGSRFSKNIKRYQRVDTLPI